MYQASKYSLSVKQSEEFENGVKELVSKLMILDDNHSQELVIACGLLLTIKADQIINIGELELIVASALHDRFKNMMIVDENGKMITGIKVAKELAEKLNFSTEIIEILDLDYSSFKLNNNAQTTMFF